MKHYTKTRVSARGGALSFADLPLFDWAREQILLAHPVVRRLVRFRHLSPTLAGVYAELFGLGGRHG